MSDQPRAGTETTAMSVAAVIINNLDQAVTDMVAYRTSLPDHDLAEIDDLAWAIGRLIRKEKHRRRQERADPPGREIGGRPASEDDGGRH